MAMLNTAVRTLGLDRLPHYIRDQSLDALYTVSDQLVGGISPFWNSLQ